MTGQQLKNSILQMAVQGKLVPQDPNDEPASVLLKRIRAEKEQLIKEGKIKKEKNPSVIFRGADNLPYEKIGKNEPVCIADEVPFEIPESWEWVRLGTVMLNRDAERIPLSVNERSKLQKIYDYYGASGIIDKVDRYLFSKPLLLIGEDGANLLLRSKPIAFIAQGKYWVNNHAHVLDAIGGIQLEYVATYINAINLSPYVTGTAQPKMNQEKMNSILVPIPPVEEQNKIIKKLNLILPLVDDYGIKEKELAQYNSKISELLKKSILQEAVQGKLVPQDSSDEPASVLLERIRAQKERLIQEGKIKRDKHESVIYRRDNSHYEKLNGIERCIDDEIPFEIPENWSWTRLRTLTSKIGAGSTPKGGRAIYQPTGVKFIRSQNVYNDGLVLNDVAYISEEINQRKSGSIVKPKDILLNITGGSIGRSALVPDDFDIGNVNQHVMIIRLLTPSIRYWVHAVLISEYIQNMIMSVQVGVSREGLSASKLMDFLIPLPSERESYRIINEYNKACNVLHQI